MNVIDSFFGEYRFLSNFCYSKIVFDGIEFPTVEHAFQSAKTLDIEQRKQISALPTPSAAKHAGRALECRSDWEAVKYQVMEDCVRYKFTKHFDLAKKLVATDDAELIEGNYWHDICWGVCGCKTCNGKGENHLGKILMKIRGELQTQIKHTKQIVEL